MRFPLLVLVVASLAAGLTSCGGDGSTDGTASGDETGASDEFATEAEQACASVTRGVVRLELRAGAYRSSPETARLERAALPIRVTALKRLQGLEPPADVKPLDYKRYLALRQSQIDANRKEVAAFEAGDTAGFSKYGSQAAAAAEAHVRLARSFGLNSCAQRLSPAAMRAARETVLRLQAKGRTKQACNDELVTPQYIEGTYPKSGIAGCIHNAAVQRKRPPFELHFLDVTGVDGVVATVTFGVTDPHLAGQSETFTLVYQDGRWKLFEIKSN